MTEPAAKPKIAPWTIWIPIIMIALGLVVFVNYVNYLNMQNTGREKQRPPRMARLETDLEGLTERSGKAVKLSDLKGKVLLLGHVYTTCPMGCATIIEEMKKIFDEFSPKHPGFQLVSFAIDTGDDAKRLRQYAEGNEITSDRWWFVNGDQTRIRNYLTKVVKFYPVIEKPKEKQTSTVDKYEHDMRVALIDAQGNLRGMYDILNPDAEFRDLARVKLRKDVAWVIDEQEHGEGKK